MQRHGDPSGTPPRPWPVLHAAACRYRPCISGGASIRCWNAARSGVWPPNSIGWRILAANLVGFVILFVGLLILSQSNRWLVDAKIDSLATQARTVAAAIAANARVDTGRLVFDQHGLVGVTQNDYDLSFGRRWSSTAGPLSTDVGVGGAFEPLSREGMLLANNVLLMVATAAVMLGTLYPLLLDSLNLGKISVGPAYFNAVFIPLMVPALFLMGVGPIARWKKATLPELATQLRWAAAAAFVATVVAVFLLGKFTPLVGFFLFVAAWIIATTLNTLWQQVRGHPFAAWGRRLSLQTGSWWGMLTAHAGVAVFVIGVTIVGGFQTEQDLRMELGSTANVGGYDFKLVGLREKPGPNYQAVQATVEISKNGKLVDTVYPDKRLYTVSRMPMTEVAIDRGVTRDVYVSMGEPLDEGRAWSMRLYVKPYVNWIWGGCVLMALGGLLAVADRRYRVTSRHHVTQELPAGAVTPR
ncbi:MAG: hypothetical protein HC937_01095 [Aquincola sp.]|nr:hypothetical protein [Aquincola sp.]